LQAKKKVITASCIALICELDARRKERFVRWPEMMQCTLKLWSGLRTKRILYLARVWWVCCLLLLGSRKAALTQFLVLLLWILLGHEFLPCVATYSGWWPISRALDPNIVCCWVQQ